MVRVGDLSHRRLSRTLGRAGADEYLVEDVDLGVTVISGVFRCIRTCPYICIHLATELTRFLYFLCLSIWGYEQCKAEIKDLHNCHEVHRFLSFFGKCNDAKTALDVCLGKEFQIRRELNKQRKLDRDEMFRQLDGEQSSP